MAFHAADFMIVFFKIRWDGKKCIRKVLCDKSGIISHGSRAKNCQKNPLLLGGGVFQVIYESGQLTEISSFVSSRKVPDIFAFF